MDNSKSSQFSKAYDYAVFLLGIRLRTEGELREKLRSKNYELGIIDTVIKQLIEQRFVNDRQYAEIFLDNLKKYKNFGFYGIKKKMMEKKLPPSIIESVLKEGLSVEEEMKIAKRFLKNYKLQITNYGEKQKIALKLRAKGFRSEVIMKLVF